MEAEQRQSLMRETYWGSLGDDVDEFGEYLEEMGLEEPTVDELKAFFMVVDYGTFCTALEWSFDDTPVRDRLYVMATDERTETLAAMTTWAKSVGLEIRLPLDAATDVADHIAKEREKQVGGRSASGGLPDEFHRRPSQGAPFLVTLVTEGGVREDMVLYNHLGPEEIKRFSVRLMD